MFSSFVILTTITAAQANQCPDGGECASHDVSPNVVVSMLQTKLQTNVLGGAAEAAASEAPDATKSLDKKTLQLQNLAENPSSILTELSEMVSRGEAPSFDLVDGIKSIVLDALSGLQPLRVASDQVTKDYLDAIQLCNDQSKTEEANIEQSDQRSVSDARSLHSACRDAESSMYEHNLTNPDSYCNKLGKFIHEATPLNMPSGMDRASSVKILAAATTSKWCATSSLSQLDNGCTAKEEELKSQRADCLGKQQSFEGLFCLWKYALQANCKALSTCHSNAVAAYSDHVGKTRTLVEKWDMETAALEKILCFCNVWRNETDEQDNRSQHNATQFDVCKTQTHTPVPMDYGTPAEKVTCLLTSVANHPGTSNFVTQEYSSFDDFVVPVVPCVQATTAAPSTASPTTTQATTAPPTTAVPTTTQAYTLVRSGYCSNTPLLRVYDGNSDNPGDTYEESVQACGMACAQQHQPTDGDWGTFGTPDVFSVETAANHPSYMGRCYCGKMATCTFPDHGATFNTYKLEAR